VCPGEHADLAGNGPYLVKLPAVRPFLFLCDGLPDKAGLDSLKSLFYVLFFFFKRVFAEFPIERVKRFFFRLSYRVLPCYFFLYFQRRAYPALREPLNLGSQVRRKEP
jgi:hypothetical protein